MIQLREKRSGHEFIKHLGPQFRCQLCKRKGAKVDARNALGFDGHPKGQKNDFRDAEAIAEVVQRPTMISCG